MKHSILFVLVLMVRWPGIVCFKGVCFTSLFLYGNKSLVLFVSPEPCQKSAVLVFLRRTVLLGREHKSSREALSIKDNSVSDLSSAFCLLCGSLALCSLAPVIIHVPLAYEILHWFSCFPVAMFPTLFLSSSQSLNAHTDLIWPPARSHLQNFVQSSLSNPSKSRLHQTMSGTDCEAGQLWEEEVSRQVVQELEFSKALEHLVPHSTVLYWVGLSTPALKLVMLLCSARSWWETFLNILDGLCCYCPAHCPVGIRCCSVQKISDGCWSAVL